MGNVSAEVAWKKFLKHGYNSSHFVWFLTALSYFQTSDGTLFGFVDLGDQIIFALDPLGWDPSTFESAWGEMLSCLTATSWAFIGIEDRFKRTLQQLGFSTLKVGEEPWVDLGKGIAKGNSGKKARSARNLAMREGVSVLSLSGDEIIQSPKLRSAIEKIYEDWKKSHSIHLGGFLNRCDPYFQPNKRHYFVAQREGEMVGALVASPIPARNAIFVEDLVQTGTSPNGTGELLVFTALEYLRALNYQCASLGVVALRNLGEFHKVPMLLRGFFKFVRPCIQSVANYSGIGVFRHHFNPASWNSIYLAFGSRNGTASSYESIKNLCCLLQLFRSDKTTGISLGSSFLPEPSF